MTQKYLKDLHSDHSEWIQNLQFYRDEIKTFKHRLEEIITQNTKMEVTANVEHFQNQFIRQNEVIDELIHDINAEEKKLVENVQNNAVATDHRKMDVNEKLVDQMTTFVKIYSELKTEFNRFASDTL